MITAAAAQITRSTALLRCIYVFIVAVVKLTLVPDMLQMSVCMDSATDSATR